MVEHQKTTINQKKIQTPSKTIADTVRNQLLESVDIEEQGSPSWPTDIEEYRTQLRRGDIECLARDVPNKQEVKDIVGSNLKRLDWVHKENLHMAIFPVTNDNLPTVTSDVREDLVAIAENQEMDVVVLPPILSENLSGIKDSIRQETSYGDEIKVVPQIKLRELSVEELKRLTNFLQEEFSKEELPILAFQRMDPLTAPELVQSLSEFTERLLMVPECPKKLHPSRYDEYGEVSAEQLYLHLGVDIVSRYFNKSPYIPESDEELSVSSLDRESLQYRRRTRTHNPISCGDCYIHKRFSHREEFKRFPEQDKEDKVNGVHNDQSSILEAKDLREALRNDKYESYLDRKEKLKETLIKMTR